MQKTGFEKKFNIGLTLDTNIKEFRRFLEAYHPYIRSIYFSLPLSKKFHTRQLIAKQLLFPHKRILFWKMLKEAKAYGVELELLFNTLTLDEDLIALASKELKKRQIEVDSVCFLQAYYPFVEKYFPDKKYIWSFNNGMRSLKAFDEAIEGRKIDAVVLGSVFIRDNEAFRYIKEKGKEIILLLNNSCSFNCATCASTSPLCQETFDKNHEKYSVEYLYALQSIFPQELRDGTIEADLIDCFKISNRGSKLSFVQNSMDSYMRGEILPYLETDCNAYAYWGRAGFFWKYFSKMDFAKIVKYKEEILGHSLDIK